MAFDFPTNLPLKKPVSVWNKPLKADFKTLFKTVGKAGVDAATGNWIGLSKDGVDTLAAIGLESNGPAELAWELIYNALTKAIASIASDGQGFMLEFLDDLTEVCDGLDFSLEQETVEISSDFFEHPERLSILPAVQTLLQQWLEKMGVETTAAQGLSERLPSYFLFELNREWRQCPQDYERIRQAFKTPFLAANEWGQGWRLYRAWLQKQIQEPMLFEAFGLEQVYVPLRGYYREKEADSSYQEKDSYRRVVMDLATTLQQWVQRGEKGDAIRMISGGPGSGKSSFAKIFAAQQGASGKIPVLFIPLHQFEPAEDLIQSVAEFLRYDGFLKDSPLNPDDDQLRLLMIFDGLDELAL